MYTVRQPRNGTEVIGYSTVHTGVGIGWSVLKILILLQMVTVGGESSPVIPLDSGSTQRAMTGSGRGTRTVVAKPLPPRQQMSPALTNLVPTHQAPSPLQGRAMHGDHLPDLTSYNIKLYAKYMIHRVALRAPPPPPIRKITDISGILLLYLCFFFFFFIASYESDPVG